MRRLRNDAEVQFTSCYQRERAQLVNLYEKAIASQWSGSDLDWAADVDPERIAWEMSDDLVPQAIRAVANAAGSPLAQWRKKEFTALGVELLQARMSQFIHGEQAAMLVAAKIVATVPWIDAKYFASTQVIDEARHTEVFSRYFDTKLGGTLYTCNPNLESQITAIVQDSRWDIAYLGMQIVIESLALGAFASLHRATTEPLLKTLLRYIMADEARHVAFGLIGLKEFYNGLSAAELKERQEFVRISTLCNQRQSLMPEVWERLGVPLASIIRAAR